MKDDSLGGSQGLLALVLIFLTQMALQGAGWQWPLLIDWGGERNLELALRGSWLACIAITGLALSWIVLRQPTYVGIGAIWLGVGFLYLAKSPWFGVVDLVGQVALLALWIEAALERPTVPQKWFVIGFATVDGFMLAAGSVARVLDPGWTPDNPDVLMRVYGPWTALLCLVPATAIIFVSWLLVPHRKS